VSVPRRGPKPCKRGHTSGRRANGTCKECARGYARDYARKRRELNPDGERARQAQSWARWVANHPEYLEARDAKHAANPAKRMFDAARIRAKKNNIPFDITLDDVVVPTHCPWLGIPLFVGTGGGMGDNPPSLDKLIPELGYTRGNIIVISGRANRIKFNGSPEELQAVANGLRAAYPQWLLTD